MSDITLSAEEVAALTGYALATKQLQVLHRRGFARAFINRLGAVVVERTHYEAVKRLQENPPEPEKDYSWRDQPPKPKIPWSETPLGRWQAENTRFEPLPRDLRTDYEKLADETQYRRRMREQRVVQVRHHSAKRRAAKINRTPSWADLEAIKALHSEARRITRETGIRHDVDHIIPLQGRLVSGLHVENNMQILPSVENSRKRNKYEVAP